LTARQSQHAEPGHMFANHVPWLAFTALRRVQATIAAKLRTKCGGGIARTRYAQCPRRMAK